MSGLPIPPYSNGDVLKTSTVNALIRSVGMTSQEGMSGVGVNAVPTAASSVQIDVADLSFPIERYYVLYYDPSNQAWSSVKVDGAILFTNESREPSGGKLSLSPLRPGFKYTLKGVVAKGKNAEWMGTHLGESSGDSDFIVIADPVNNTYSRVLYVGGRGGSGNCDCNGGTTPIQAPECEIIEPVRCPRFYDPDVTPNPLAYGVDSDSLSTENVSVGLLNAIRGQIQYSNSVNAFMAMGLIKVANKDYQPIHATYVGGEEYEDETETIQKRKRGEFRYIEVEEDDKDKKGKKDNKEDAGDKDGDKEPQKVMKPLYLRKRTLAEHTNHVAKRMGGDTAYPFQWEYSDGTPFRSHTEAHCDKFVEKTYYESHELLADTYEPTNESGGTQESDSDPLYGFLEMKPYLYERDYGEQEDLLGSGDDTEGEADTSAASTVASTALSVQKEFNGISPQTWLLTYDEQDAQLDYDFGICFDLAYAETLVPGEKVECKKRAAKIVIAAFTEYGEPDYEIVIDGMGNPVYTPDGQPVYVLDDYGNKIQKTKVITFAYYELIPPESYLVQIDGHPNVNLYVCEANTAEIYAGADPTKQDGKPITKIDITRMTLTHEYVPPEDIVQPDYEYVQARCLDESNSSIDIVNPLGVVNDLATDVDGRMVPRCRALFYKTDDKKRKFPILFEVDTLPYGYAIETGVIQNYYITEDTCSPYYVRPNYTVNRTYRNDSKKGKILQLAKTECFKHSLQLLSMPMVDNE